MPTPIQLPALSPTMEEGRITKWLKNEGDTVKSGDAIAECETDKSNLEIEATDSGTLLKILVPAGSAAKIGSTIAWLGKPGEAVPDAGGSEAPKGDAKKDEPKKDEPKKDEAKTEPAKKAEPKTEAPKSEAAAQEKPAQTPPSKPLIPAKPKRAAAQTSASDRQKVSPVARKIAEAQGVDLSGVSGSGPQGRVIKRDVEEALANPPAAPAEPSAAKKGPALPLIRVTPGERKPNDAIPLTQMRKVIAHRLGEVKPGVPHFYLTIDVEMDQALQLRQEAKDESLKISVNDIIVKATAMAVRRFPRINQFFSGDKIEQMHTVDVGVAVAIEDGLITPVIRDADQKGLAQIAAEVRELADRAKRKALKPDEYSGGSITVSNLGMFGIDSFIAVINPPQAAILAVGRVEPKVVVREGQMVIRQMMSITLSGDHRVIDGAVGAQFLEVLRAYLEHPLRLVL